MKNGNFMKKIVTIISLAVLMIACASPTVVKSVKPNDSGLNCLQLQNEFAEAEQLKAAALKEKGMTGGNVVRAIFFWPAILGTASNANEAIAAADTRMSYLGTLMSQKNCNATTATAPADIAKPAETTPK